MDSQMPLIAEGTVLDNDFKVGVMVGGGGFGRIYEAYQLSLGGRKVAVKLERYSESWQNDADVLARINAKRFLPQVYKKFEISDDAGGLYICLVMEFINGESVESVIKNLNPLEHLPVRRIVKWITQLCAALEELHGKNILHTDVKPSNIMIDEHDDVRLIDFNTAVINNRVSVWGLCTSNGFSPPEQYAVRVGEAEGHTQYRQGRVNVTGDIYSLGAVLYFLIFRRVPQTSESRKSKKFIAERSGLIKDYAPFYKVIEKAASLSPVTRYQSAREMSEAVVKAERRMNFWTLRAKTVTVAAVLAAILALGVLTYKFMPRDRTGEIVSVFNGDVTEETFKTKMSEFKRAQEQIVLCALRAEALCGAGEYEYFLTEYESYPERIKNYPHKQNVSFYAGLLYWAGEAYYNTDGYETAKTYFVRADALQPDNLLYLKALCRSLAALGENAELERLYADLSSEQKEEIGPDWLSFFDGMAQKKAGNYREAERAFTEALKTDDSQLLWTVIDGCSAMFKDNREYEKQADFLTGKQRIFKSPARQAVIGERLGESLMSLGRTDEAVSCYRELLSSQPFSYRAHELLASAQDAGGYYDDEKITLEEMIRLAPNNVRGYVLYVNVLLQTENQKPYEARDYNQAYDVFLIAWELDPNDADVRIYQGVFEDMIKGGILVPKEG